MRHGDYEDASAAHPTGKEISTQKVLTAAGRRACAKAGRVLHELGVHPQHIVSSPLIRARQTAQIVAEALQWQGTLAVSDSLESGATPNTPRNEGIVVGI